MVNKQLKVNNLKVNRQLLMLKVLGVLNFYSLECVIAIHV